MGKYKEHRERRGKRNVWDQDTLSGHVFEPSSFLDLPSVPPNVVDAEVLWFNAGKGFGFVKLSDGTEAYLHIRVLEAAGGHDLSDGTHLKVTVEEGSARSPDRQSARHRRLDPSSPRRQAVRG